MAPPPPTPPKPAPRTSRAFPREKSSGRFALVVSLVERVSRRGNVGVTKTYSSKQRDSAQDVVITDLHVAMVSFDFCPGSSISVPFVSYEISQDPNP